MLQFLLGLIIGAGGMWLLDSLPAGRQAALRPNDNNSKTANADQGHLATFNQQRAQTEQQNKQKILDALQEKSSITNEDVQKLLNISDSTAERYLDELEKEGKLKQSESTGRDVFYTKI